MPTSETTNRIVRFIESVGIPVKERGLDDDTFLPGILIDGGSIVLDRSRLAYPGDLLHEAGHIAMIPEPRRGGVTGNVAAFDDLISYESESIAWSYAAAVELKIDPRIVFHANGYKGNGESLLTGYSMGVYIGLPGLEEAGMAYGPMAAESLGVDPFPHMVSWMRREAQD